MGRFVVFATSGEAVSCHLLALGLRSIGEMELLLNLIWLVVAASLVVVWWTCWLPQLTPRAADERTRRLRGRQSLIGLICVVALLFPAISLTDDLHPAVVAVSDSKSLYAAAHVHDSVNLSPRSHTPWQASVGAVWILRFRAALWPSDLTLIGAWVFGPSDSHYRQTPCRAPPSLS